MATAFLGMAERGVHVDHATLNRWVVKYSPLIVDQAHRRKSQSYSRGHHKK
jgi:putative transposase